MTDRSLQAEITTGRQIDFVSHLTFVKGTKQDYPDQYVRLNRTIGKNKKKFKHWCMPLEQTGYMKCRMHDFL